MTKTEEMTIETAADMIKTYAKTIEDTEVVKCFFEGYAEGNEGLITPEAIAKMDQLRGFYKQLNAELQRVAN